MNDGIDISKMHVLISDFHVSVMFHGPGANTGLRIADFTPQESQSVTIVRKNVDEILSGAGSMTLNDLSTSFRHEYGNGGPYQVHEPGRGIALAQLMHLGCTVESPVGVDALEKNAIIMKGLEDAGCGNNFTKTQLERSLDLLSTQN
jgi:hypothetical protein